MHQITSDIKRQIDNLSVIGKQCSAVICFERFCRKYKLSHQYITDFINHVWKVCQVNPTTFVEWDEAFQDLAITGQGDPYPEELLEQIPKELLNDFNKMSQAVFETSATTWYGDNLPGTRKELFKVITLSLKHDINVPDFSLYTNPPIEDRGGWGPVLSDEVMKKWRKTC